MYYTITIAVNYKPTFNFLENTSLGDLKWMKLFSKQNLVCVTHCLGLPQTPSYVNTFKYTCMLVTQNFSGKDKKYKRAIL